LSLYLVDFKSNQVVLDVYLYADFKENYKQLKREFHCFEVEDHIVGLLFADDFDAPRFAGKIVQTVGYLTNQGMKLKTKPQDTSKAQKKEVVFSAKRVVMKKKKRKMASPNLLFQLQKISSMLLI
jgi:hypothetical protein